MTNPKHTPGMTVVWGRVNNFIVTANEDGTIPLNSKIICELASADQVTPEHLRLIVAAPRLLEALKTLRHKLDNYDGQSLGSFATIADEAIDGAE